MVVGYFVSMGLLFITIFGIIYGIYTIVYSRRLSRFIGIIHLVIGIIAAYLIITWIPACYGTETLVNGFIGIIGAIVGTLISTAFLGIAVLNA